MRLMKLVVLGSVVFLLTGLSSANAARSTHTYVKQLLEMRFGLVQREIGMTAVRIPSSDCRIRIVDGSATPSVGGDQAALQVMKGNKTLSFFVSEKMSYDVLIGSVLDFTSEKRGGLTTHSTLLKIGASKLVITKLPLYPSNDTTEDNQSLSISCQL